MRLLSPRAPDDRWRHARSGIGADARPETARSADRARFRAIARGSAMESGALLDVIRLFNVVPQEDWAQAKSLLVRVVEMLSKMC